MRIKYLLFIIIGILFLSMILSYIPFFGAKIGSLNQVENPLKTLDNPSSKPLFISHHATISSEFFSQTLPANVSFTLVKEWVSKNTTIVYEGVSSSNDWATNGNFNSNITPWVSQSSDPGKIEMQGWALGGYASILINRGVNLTQSDYGIYEQTHSLQELFTPNKLVSFSMDYYYDPDKGKISTNAQAYMAVKIGNVEKNYTLFFSDLVQKSWIKMIMTYSPASIGQALPNNVTLKVGVSVNGSEMVPRDQLFSIDNVQFKMWTQPNLPNLLIVRDYETGNYTYKNTSFGKGQTIIDIEKSYQETHVVTLTIFSNMTDAIDMEISKIIIISDAVKINNSTIDGVEGSTYFANGLITWSTEWETNIPYTYFNNWIEIEKPLDWNITHIIDGYDNEQTGQCLGVGLGSNKVIIPSGIVAGGLWILEAESFNYIDYGYITVWNGTTYEIKSNLFVGDIFQIQVILNNTIPLLNTLITCTINYPNGTIWWEESRELESSTVTFSNNTRGLSMPIGTYHISVKWTNNRSILSRDKAGFLQLQFSIIHHTNLKAIESYLEKVAGTPTLVKVKFEDKDLNTTISLAEVTFRSTYGDSGIMAYMGSGIYMAELDTSLLNVGDYYLSFNASKGFYQNQSTTNLIHLRICPESLVLEVPRTVKSCMANSYAYYKLNVTGAISGMLLHPANLTTDWIRDYTFIDFIDGTYGLNLSTFEVTSSSIPETFTITIWANKSLFGSTSDVILLTVYPNPAQIGVNTSLVEVTLGDLFYIKVNYTIEGSKILISNASCNIVWSSSYNVLPVADGFIISCNTTELSIDVYTLLIQVGHPGYETEQEIILVIVQPIESELRVLNKVPIEFVKGDLVNISCRFLAKGQDIINATIILVGDLTGDLQWNGSAYYYTINTTTFTPKSYFIQIIGTQPNVKTQIKEVIFRINPMVVQIKLPISAITYQEGEENTIYFSILDINHGILRSDLTVVCSFNDFSIELNSLPNNSFILDLNAFELPSSKNAHPLNITVLNPYGEDTYVILYVYVPPEETSYQLLLWILGIIIGAISSILVGLFVNNRYFRLTKFQRYIQKSKNQLIKKGKIEKFEEMNREKLIQHLLEQEIPISKINGKNI